MSRNRSLGTTVNGGDIQVIGLGPNNLGNNTTISTAPVVDFVSLMMDDPSGGKRKTKSCLHYSYVLEPGYCTVYDGSHMGNAPTGPWAEYKNTLGWHMKSYPPATIGAGYVYIPVSSDTSDDIGNCVFRAYNDYINGIRALDSSQSLAEAGETPALFRLWQRRKAAPSNIVNGFLNYSFGWKPLMSDLIAVAKELRRFPKTVRKRLKAIGNKEVVRHFKYDLSHTVDDLNLVHYEQTGTLWFQNIKYETKTVDKRRTVTVTIRAKVRPKMSGQAQDILNRLGALGLIPSLATVWAVTRLSFVVDWFYNIGGAIENLQGSLTHDINVTDLCVTDLITRDLVTTYVQGGVSNVPNTGKQKSFYRASYPKVPYLPSLTVPRRPMQYVLLALIAAVNTKGGNKALRLLDNSPPSKALNRLAKKAAVKVRSKYKRFRNWLDYDPNDNY